MGRFVVAKLYNKVFLSEENTTATDADIAVMELNFSLNYLEKSSENITESSSKKENNSKKSSSESKTSVAESKTMEVTTTVSESATTQLATEIPTIESSDKYL